MVIWGQIGDGYGSEGLEDEQSLVCRFCGDRKRRGRWVGGLIDC